MFIVIEGTDASGKTTLIEAVKNELHARYTESPVIMFHKGKPEEKTRRWVLRDYVTSVERQNWFRQVALSDRWHWGEVTYAPKYRPDTNKDGYGLLGKAGWRWTELFLLSRGVAQFWLYQPLEVIQARLAARGDEFVQVEDLSDILSQYRIAAEQSIGLATVQPDPESLDTVSQLAATIVDSALLVEEQARHLEIFPHYIGSPRPKVLLVGDERNIVKKYGEETTLPFMPVDGNSAEYLLTALPDDLWHQVGIININDGDNKYSFNALWNQLGFPKIIALGRLAEKTLASIPIHENYYTVLPHPQYVRRFFNKTKEEYGQAIKRVADGIDKKEEQWILR
jgi:gluconate kinase